jgi:hypothetical protein
MSHKLSLLATTVVGCMLLLATVVSGPLEKSKGRSHATGQKTRSGRCAIY